MKCPACGTATSIHADWKGDWLPWCRYCANYLHEIKPRRKPPLLARLVIAFVIVALLCSIATS